MVGDGKKRRRGEAGEGDRAAAAGGGRRPAGGARVRAKSSSTGTRVAAAAGGGSQKKGKRRKKDVKATKWEHDLSDEGDDEMGVGGGSKPMKLADLVMEEEGGDEDFGKSSSTEGGGMYVAQEEDEDEEEEDGSDDCTEGRGKGRQIENIRTSERDTDDGAQGDVSSSEDDIVEDEEGEGEDGEEKSLRAKKKGGMGDVMARIMMAPVKGGGLVLARRKTKAMREMEEDNSKKREGREKREMRRRNLTKQVEMPSVVQGADNERQLRKVATRGVVALFNAIQKQQHAKGAAAGAGEDGEAVLKTGREVKDISKAAFLGMLKSQATPASGAAAAAGNGKNGSDSAATTLSAKSKKKQAIAAGAAMHLQKVGGAGIQEDGGSAASGAGAASTTTWAGVDDSLLIAKPKASVKAWDQESDEDGF